MLRQEAIVDLSNNTLRTSMITSPIYRYRYVRPEVGAVASSAGEFTFYGALTGAGIGVILALVLYPFSC